ncbi:MAG TPA: polysaccharide biosynthesis/export family protein [Stellaceae bacterium]|nr:polysaccharide biosynthesis/export family protein [Stellaceae bacterium]
MRRVTVIALALALAGCAAAKAPPLASGTVTPSGAPLAPEHTLTAGDVFEIRFPFSPEFNDKITVGEDGTVAPKLIGSVVVGGLTVNEATKRLSALYARQIKYPTLSLTVRSYAPEVLWVEGAVAKPGLVRSDLPLTLERAVTEAGGLKTGAETGDILVIRRDETGNVHAYQEALAPAPGSADPVLKSYDVVYVPLSPIGSVNEFLAGYVKNLPFSATYNIVPVAPAQQLIPRVAVPH